jgi:hypothetical protein
LDRIPLNTYRVAPASIQSVARDRDPGWFATQRWIALGSTVVGLILGALIADPSGLIVTDRE